MYTPGPHQPTTAAASVSPRRAEKSLNELDVLIAKRRNELSELRKNRPGSSISASTPRPSGHESGGVKVLFFTFEYSQIYSHLT